MNPFAALMHWITRGHEIQTNRANGSVAAYRDEEDRFCVRLSTYDKELAKRALDAARKVLAEAD